MNHSIVILAAGQGTRMRSALPKVLHLLAGKTLLAHVLDTALQLEPEAIYLVYGHGGEQVKAATAAYDLHYVEQAEQLGTGHAVMQAMPQIPDNHQVMVLYGDVPLIDLATLQGMMHLDEDVLGLLTVELDDPTGYGRIVRSPAGAVQRIVEEKDADVSIRKIREINTGIMSMPAHNLRQCLSALKNDNAQGEYYLTDVIGLAVQAGLRVQTFTPDTLEEVQGINDRVQLAMMERYYQQQQALQLMRNGVTLRDPERLDVRGELTTGRDLLIDINVVLEGNVELGNGVHIGANCVIRHAKIADNVEILPNCVIENAVIEAGCRIGPFARIRPDTHLAEQVHIGNFVEVKKSTVEKGSKINHLSYIGDSEVGSEVNIGAGTITCNYDGANKHKTIIGDRAFIGSDTQLVAPVEVGADATIGAGATITKNVEAGHLALSRAPQKSLAGWQRPVKKKSH